MSPELDLQKAVENHEADVSLLKLEYDQLCLECEDYAVDHNIMEFKDADETYCNLLIKRENAFADYKKAKDGENWFYYRYAEVVNKRISIFKDKINHIKWQNRRNI